MIAARALRLAKVLDSLARTMLIRSEAQVAHVRLARERRNEFAPLAAGARSRGSRALLDARPGIGSRALAIAVNR